jgi:dTDP-4-dehydrorhamnose reductase
MKIMTLGNGFVSRHLPYDKITNRIYPDPQDIDWVLSKHKPDVLVNCIGRVGFPNVDWCDRNRTETYMVNVILPGLISSWCQKHDVHLIHLSSGCIFYDRSPNYIGNVEYGWKESDHANPQSYYSKSKYACDLMLGDLPSTTLLRLRMPISYHNDSRNLINKLIGYQQVIDIPNSMTFMSDLVRGIDWAAKQSRFGIYHMTNPDPLTAADIMREYQKYVPSHIFQIIDQVKLNRLTIAKRSNCLLNTDKLTSSGFYMTPSRQALQDTMRIYMQGDV